MGLNMCRMGLNASIFWEGVETHFYTCWDPFFWVLGAAVVSQVRSNPGPKYRRVLQCQHHYQKSLSRTAVVKKGSSTCSPQASEAADTLQRSSAQPLHTVCLKFGRVVSSGSQLEAHHHCNMFGLEIARPAAVSADFQLRHVLVEVKILERGYRRRYQTTRLIVGRAGHWDRT